MSTKEGQKKALIPASTMAATVRSIVLPYMQSTASPAFSMAEMFVMALVPQAGPWPAKFIQRWIFSASAYYREMAYKDWFDCTKKQEFVRDFEQVFYQLASPLKKVRGEESELNMLNDLWTVPANEGMFFLRHLLQPKQNQANDKPFRLMDLPPELRKDIFSMALGLPKSGNHIRHTANVSRQAVKANIVTSTRSYDAPFDIKTPLRDFELQCPSLPKQLALLQTNKTVFKEAEHLYYSLNTFVCGNQFQLGEFLERLVPSRRMHLRHISFKFAANPAPGTCTTFKMLKEIEHLQELDIEVDEQKWLDLRRRDGSVKYASITEIPGMSVLRSFRGMKRVGFHGHCDGIKQYLEKEMVRSKEDGKEKKGKKRKAGSDDGKKGKNTKVAKE